MKTNRLICRMLAMMLVLTFTCSGRVCAAATEIEDIDEIEVIDEIEDIDEIEEIENTDEIEVIEDITEIPDDLPETEEPLSVGRRNNAGKSGWSFDKKTGTLTCDKKTADSSWRKKYKPDDIKKVVFTNNVTNIEREAFDNCRYITDIRLSGTIKRIGDSAFSFCNGNGDGGLEKIVIPKGVEEIGCYAFACENLKTVSLPDTLTTIESGAFSGNEDLENISIPGSVTSLGSWSLEGITNIYLHGVTLIEECDLVDPYYDENRNIITCLEANKRYDTLISKEFVSDGSDNIKRGGICGDIKWTIDNNGLLYLRGDGDFAYESSVQFYYDNDGNELSIGAIRNDWCKYADEIKKVKISIRGVRSIESICRGLKKATAVQFSNCDFSKVIKTTFAFSGCSELKKIKMNDFDMPACLDIGYMFNECRKLESVNLDGTHMPNVQDMSYLFGQTHYFADDTYTGDTDERLTDFSWKDSRVSHVRNLCGMFEGCKKLEKVDLSGFNSSEVDDIRYMFFGCINLKEVDLSGIDMRKADSTWSYMFTYCDSLTKIITPRKTGETVPELPKPMYDQSNGKEYYSLPKNAKKSITLGVDKNVRKDIGKATVSGVKNKTYTGKKITQSPTVRYGNKTLKEGTDYKVSYRKNKNAGTATMIITGKGKYKGTLRSTFKIKKAPVKISAKKITLKTSDIKKKEKKVKAAGVFNITENSGRVTYGKTSGDKKISVSKKGMITVAKGLKKGNYTVKVRVTAEGDENHKGTSSTVTVKIVIK